MEFYQADPTLENYWRGVILFGRNVASYKFALASALYEVDKSGSDLITLDQLAVPFSRYLCEHLKHAPKQITSRSSQFLDTCLKFNRGEITHAQLIEATVRLGFNNVIDAFHYVNQGEIDKRFFLDERKTHNGIRLTDNFYLLGERLQYKNLAFETNARWNLVEQAWSMRISRNLVGVEFDEDNQLLFTRVNARRVDITSCRDSLNGYQKGRCFYCFKPISLVPGDAELADVDHFIPWAEKAREFWTLITEGDGGFHRSEYKKYYRANINIPVRYSEPDSIDNIRQVLAYMTKIQQKHGLLLFGCNDVPERPATGRPRKSDF